VLPRAQWHTDVHADALTLHHFLSHTHHLTDGVIVTTAAFTGAVPESSWPSLLRYSAPAGHADLVYSNLGYNVAAMAIDAVRPEGWRRFMAQRMFAPLGMQQTFARVSGLDRDRIAMPHDFRADGHQPSMPFVKTDETMNSAGGHLATLDDLARWVTVQLDSGMLDGRRVFPESAVVQSQTQIAPHTRDRAKQFAFFLRTGWSAGWDIGTYEGERMVSRFGSYSSTRSHLSMLPGRRIGVVALTTGRLASLATDIVAAYAYDLEAGRPDAEARAAARLDTLTAQVARAPRQVAQSDSVRASRQQPLDRALSDFAGTYKHDGLGAITFRVQSNRLRWNWGVLRGEAEVFDAAKRALRIELSGSGYIGEFEFPERGPATAVQLDGMRFSRVP
jgi:CubicO group peptidase (beta-lactamase class C family)